MKRCLCATLPFHLIAFLGRPYLVRKNWVGAFFLPKSLMNLTNLKQQSPQSSSFDDGELPLVTQAILGKALPGKHVTWRPSPDEEYELYVQVLSDTEREFAEKRVVDELSKMNLKSLPEQQAEDIYSAAMQKQIVHLAVREGQCRTFTNPATGETVTTPRRLVFKNVQEVGKLSTDRIAQLFRLYVAMLEAESPSWHHLSQIKDMDQFCKTIADNNDGGAVLFLGSMASPALAELTIGVVRFLLNHTQHDPLPNTFSVEFANSNPNTLQSTESLATTSESPSSDPNKTLTADQVKTLMQTLNQKGES